MSARFNGSSDYLIGSFAPVTAAPLTMIAFVIPTAHSSSADLFTINNGNGGTGVAFRLNLTSTSTRAIAVGTGNGIATLSTPAPINRISMVAAVFTSATSRYAWLNGVASSVNTDNQAPASVTTTTIGRFYSTFPNYFTGFVGRVLMYGAALSQAELVAIWQGISPRSIRFSSLAGWWELGPSGRLVDLAAGREITVGGGRPRFGPDIPQHWSIDQRRPRRSLLIQQALATPTYGSPILRPLRQMRNRAIIRM